MIVQSYLSERKKLGAFRESPVHICGDRHDLYLFCQIFAYEWNSLTSGVTNVLLCLS